MRVIGARSSCQELLPVFFADAVCAQTGRSYLTGPQRQGQRSQPPPPRRHRPPPFPPPEGTNHPVRCVARPHTVTIDSQVPTAMYPLSIRGLRAPTSSKVHRAAPDGVAPRSCTRQGPGCRQPSVQVMAAATPCPAARLSERRVGRASRRGCTAAPGRAPTPRLLCVPVRSQKVRFVCTAGMGG